MPNFSNIIDPARNWWDSATPPTRAAAVGLGAVVIAGLIFAAILAASPDYTPVFRDVPPRDAAAIETTLREHNIPMQFNDKDGTVSVPSKDESEATMSVEAAGILSKDKDPNSAAVEGISQISPLMDHDAETAQLIHANESEIDRKLQGLNAINTAAVTFAPGDQNDVFSPDVAPTASVILGIKQGQSLDDDQINGIVNLVADSYSNLKPENITVLDQNSNALWNPKSSNHTPNIDKQFQSDEAYAQTIKTKLLDELSVFGPNNTRVAVNAVLDHDQTHIDQTENTKGPTVSNTSTEEKLQGNVAPPVGGVPGVASNTGPTVYEGGGSASGAGNYSKTSELNNYAVNTTHKIIDVGFGSVKSLSATVWVNSTVAAPDIAKIQQMVATTIGVQPGDPTRAVAVNQVKFDNTAQKAADAQMRSVASQEMWANIIKVITVSIVGCILLYFLTRTSKRRMTGEPQLALAGGGANIGFLEDASDQDVGNMLEERPLRIEDVLAEMPDAEQPRHRRRRMHAPSIEEQQDLKLESIQEMINTHPESVALLMKGWIAE